MRVCVNVLIVILYLHLLWIGPIHMSNLIIDSFAFERIVISVQFVLSQLYFARRSENTTEKSQ